MKKHYALMKGVAVVLLAIAFNLETNAQLSVAATATTYTVNFDGTVAGVENGTWAGTGFQPVPAVGRLDSDAWQVTGWSSGNLAFGGTRVTTGTDYTRGAFAGGVAVGGMYAFSGGAITGQALGFQPGSSDWDPGAIIMRIRNTTGVTLTEFDVAYNVFWNNDQASSSDFDFSYSSNGISFTSVGALDVTSPTTADALGFTVNARSTTISGLNIANNGYFYIRWRGQLVSGSGARDEFALDDIQVTGYDYTMVRFSGSSTTANENGVSTMLTLTITNPDATNATLVDVVLISGSAARISGYTTQTKTFPAGSGANQTVTVTITDNGACDLNEVLVFELQNISGGNNASIGTPSQYTLTIDDNETGPYTAGQQYFDGGVNDNWTITAGGGNVSATTGAGDTPASQRVLSSPNSWQVNNGTATLDLGTISTLGMSSMTLSARLSSTSTSPTGGSDGSDSVAFFVDLDGGGFPLDPDISVSGNSNRRYGYAATGVATTTAGTPVTYICNFGGNGIDYATVQITVPNGTNTVALRVIAKNNNADEVWNVDNVQLTGTLCQPIYYSRGNGDETTATWHTTRTGPGTAVTFDENASMVVQLGHTVTTTGSAFDVRSLNVETGGTLNMGGTTTLGVFGPTFDIDGTFSAANDDFEFQGTALQTISGSAGTITLDDLTLDGAGGILVSVNTLKIMGTLQLDNGNFNANAKEVQLISNASGTARLGPVAPTASYSSYLRQERYIPAGVTDWRLLCSPIQNKKISDWTDDFITSGFPGSTWPGFSFNSINTYDETDPGPNDVDGLTGATNVTNPLTVGMGLAAWSGDNMGGTSAFVVDVRGLPQIASTPFSLPMTWTNTGVGAVDGLNLVGNPVASPIDFSLVTLGADVDNFYWIYDPGAGSNASWDEGLSIGTGGTNGNIQSSQGFWLHCTGSGCSATVTESAKVLEPLAGGVFSSAPETREMVRLKLSTGMNGFNDETLVHFIAGEPTMGAHDIQKFDFHHPDAPSICTEASDGTRLIINAQGPLTGTMDVPVQVDVAITGDYTITFADVQPVLGRTCLMLEDLATGISTPLSEGGTYTFAIDAGDPAIPARFVLHMGEPITTTVADASCAGAIDGTATAMGAGSGPWDYSWMDAFGNVILQENGLTGPSAISSLGAGSYMVSIAGNAGCGTITGSIAIDEPPVLDATATSSPAACAAAENGSIDLSVMGGTAPYAFDWSDGTTAEDLVNAAEGTYDVTITDANGCTFVSQDLMVAAGAAPHAGFVPSAVQVMVGEEVEFFNFSTHGLDYTWDFGDGFVSNDAEPIHAFGTPGIHVVSLLVENGACQAEFSMDIEVGTTTGITTPVASGMNAWSDGDRIFVTWEPVGVDDVQVRVMDEAGRIVHEARAPQGDGRLIVDAVPLAYGSYVVRVRQAMQERSVKVVLIR